MVRLQAPGLAGEVAVERGHRVFCVLVSSGVSFDLLCPLSLGGELFWDVDWVGRRGYVSNNQGTGWYLVRWIWSLSFGTEDV